MYLSTGLCAQIQMTRNSTQFHAGCKYDDIDTHTHTHTYTITHMHRYIYIYNISGGLRTKLFVPRNCHEQNWVSDMNMFAL